MEMELRSLKFLLVYLFLKKMLMFAFHCIASLRPHHSLTISADSGAGDGVGKEL